MQKSALPQPDVLAWPLEAAEARLKERGCIYTIEETLAPRESGACFERYVVRQVLKENGVQTLTVCRKHGKEVL